MSDDFDRNDLALLTVEGGSVVGTGEGVLEREFAVGQIQSALWSHRVEESNRETFPSCCRADNFPATLLLSILSMSHLKNSL